jgi:hypothetical protein
MACERLPEESAAVTVMVWMPAGVPVFVGGLEGEEELQPENESKPTAKKAMRRLARVRRRLSPRSLRGDSVRKMRLAHAIPCSGIDNVWRRAVVGAVVVMVRVLVTTPLAGVTEAGAKVQLAPVGRVPQENLTVHV